MENKKRGFHVTIVDNETGKTVQDFNTRGIKYVHLDENQEAAKKAERADRQIGAVAMCAGNHLNGVNPFEELALLDGVQGLIKSAMEENPMLQILMMITEQKRAEEKIVSGGSEET